MTLDGVHGCTWSNITIGRIQVPRGNISVIDNALIWHVPPGWSSSTAALSSSTDSSTAQPPTASSSSSTSVDGSSSTIASTGTIDSASGSHHDESSSSSISSSSSSGTVEASSSSQTIIIIACAIGAIIIGIICACVCYRKYTTRNGGYMTDPSTTNQLQVNDGQNSYGETAMVSGHGGYTALKDNDTFTHSSAISSRVNPKASSTRASMAVPVTQMTDPTN